MAYNSNQNQELKKDFLKLQEGCCAVCGDKPPDRPQLDHNHRTGAFRGVLCIRCNMGLGSFCDSLELLQRAIHYLGIPRIARFPRRLTNSEAKSRALKGNHNCLGYKFTEDHRRRLSEGMKGNQNFLGHKHTKTARCKMRKAQSIRWKNVKKGRTTIHATHSD